VAQAPTPEAPAQPPDVIEPRLERRDHPEVFRFGSDYTLPEGDTAQDVVIVAGNATIAGETQDMVIIGGSVRLASTAVVSGDAVVVAGRMSVEQGATVTGDLVIVGGRIDSPGGFVPGGEQVVVGSAVLDSGVATMLPWVTRGFLFGRPIVPSLPWVWGFVLVALLVYMLISVIFPTPVTATTRALAEAPLTAFIAGLIVLLAVGPIVLLLAVSVVGLVVIPFALCALFLAALVGRIGAIRWLGRSVVAEDDPSSHAQTVRSLAIGAVILSLVYMVPVLGMVTWASIGVMGLGAAAVACAAGLRRENPKRPVPPPSPIPPSTLPADGFMGAPVIPPPVDASGAAAIVTPPPFAAGAPFAGAPFAAGAPAGGAAGVQAATIDLTLMPRATFTQRLAALALDVLLVAMTSAFLDLNDGPGSRMFLLLLVYHVGFWAWKGTTVGGIICQLRVTRTDGQPLRLADALVRALSGIFSFAVLGLGYLWILKDPERQAWHDRIAGTFVVKVPANLPLP
jgi:uncharacterized RDD family membrane protein YckC